MARTRKAEIDPKNGEAPVPPGAPVDEKALTTPAHGASMAAIVNAIQGETDSKALVKLADAHGLEVVSLGDDKLWLRPVKGTMIGGKVLGVETREGVDERTGEVRTKKDFMVQIKAPTKLFVRGSGDPVKEDGREIVEVERDGAVVKMALAQVDDVVYVSEVYDLKPLHDLIGEDVIFGYRGKAAIGKGRKVWRCVIFKAPEGADWEAVANTSIT